MARLPTAQIQQPQLRLRNPKVDTFRPCQHRPDTATRAQRQHRRAACRHPGRSVQENTAGCRTVDYVYVPLHRLAPLLPSRRPISPARRQLSSSSPQPAAQLLRSMSEPGLCFSTVRRRLWPRSMGQQRRRPRMGSSPPGARSRVWTCYVKCKACYLECMYWATNLALGIVCGA